jgi:hypothetical protein
MGIVASTSSLYRTAHLVLIPPCCGPRRWNSFGSSPYWYRAERLLAAVYLEGLTETGQVTITSASAIGRIHIEAFAGTAAHACA